MRWWTHKVSNCWLCRPIFDIVNGRSFRLQLNLDCLHLQLVSISYSNVTYKFKVIPGNDITSLAASPKTCWKRGSRFNSDTRSSRFGGQVNLSNNLKVWCSVGWDPWSSFSYHTDNFPFTPGCRKLMKLVAEYCSIIRGGSVRSIIAWSMYKCSHKIVQFLSTEVSLY